MSNLREILREEYIKEINKIDVKTLMTMIEEVLDSPLTIVEEEEVPSIAKMDDDKTLEMILQMIPEIEVSELGWGDVSGPEKDIKGAARLLLEGYLENIQGTSLGEKIKSVGAFYGPGAVDMIEETGRTAERPMTAKIKQAISYLVFYKTLTKVLTNFNASSAGFSFESFLATLSDGYQIPANKGTIADYVDRLGGGEIPISLKLYKETKLKVDGSYTDLVRDLVKPQFSHPKGHAMRYVVCTKDMDKDPVTKKALPTAQQQGKIHFWQFDFTIQNVMAILVNSMDKSQECIRLPKEVVSKLNRGWSPTEDDSKNLLRLPAQMEASEDELEAMFLRKLEGNLAHLKEQNPQSLMHFVDDEMYKQLMKDLNWKENDELFKPVELPPDETEEDEEGSREKKMGVRRGESMFIAKVLKDWLKVWFDSYYTGLPEDHPMVQTLNALTPNQRAKAIGTGYGTRGLIDGLWHALRDANQGDREKVMDEKTQQKKFKYDKPEMDPRAGLIATQAAAYKKSEREKILDAMEKAGEFYSPLESAYYYGQWAAANDMQKMSIGLYHTKGYLRRKHFFMNQTQATNSADPVIVPKENDKGEKPIDSIKDGGTGAVSIGFILVGGFYVGEVLNEIRKLLDREIFDIFTQLRSLSDNLNEYFADGLNNDTLANKAIGNADAIGGTTKTLKKKYPKK